MTCTFPELLKSGIGVFHDTVHEVAAMCFTKGGLGIYSCDCLHNTAMRTVAAVFSVFPTPQFPSLSQPPLALGIIKDILFSTSSHARPMAYLSCAVTPNMFHGHGFLSAIGTQCEMKYSRNSLYMRLRSDLDPIINVSSRSHLYFVIRCPAANPLCRTDLQMTYY